MYAFLWFCTLNTHLNLLRVFINTLYISQFPLKKNHEKPEDSRQVYRDFNLVPPEYKSALTCTVTDAFWIVFRDRSLILYVVTNVSGKVLPQFTYYPED